MRQSRAKVPTHIYAVLAALFILISLSFQPLPTEKFVPKELSSQDPSEYEQLEQTIAPTQDLKSARRRHLMQAAKNETSVSIIPILSGQRSSSTFLAFQVMAAIPCHVSINEVLFKDEGQSRDAWKVEAEQLGFADEPNARKVDPEILADFVIQVGKRRCKEKLDNDPLLAQQCGNHCWVNYKHFHLHLSIWQHQMMWESLIEKTKDANTEFALAILERDVSERWRSTWYAKHSGDWNIVGDAKHREKVTTADIPPMEAQFWHEHTNWYEMVRGFANITNQRRLQKHEPPITVMEFEYSSLVKQPTEQVQAFIQKQLGLQVSMQVAIS